MGLGWGRHERRACSRAQRRFASVPAYAGSYREPLLRRNQAQPVVHDRQHVNLCAVRECGWGGAELSRQGRINRSSPATMSEAPRCLLIVASMPSTSSNSRTRRSCNFKPKAWVAACASFRSTALDGLRGSRRYPTREILGTTSLSSCTYFPKNPPPVTYDTPVTLPPGRARLVTRPMTTGSPPIPTPTIGIAWVVFLAARVGAPDPTTMTSTLRRTSSAASWG